MLGINGFKLKWRPDSAGVSTKSSAVAGPEILAGQGVLFLEAFLRTSSTSPYSLD